MTAIEKIKASFVACAALMFAAGASAALPQKVIGPGLGSGESVSYHQNWNRVLSADTVYILTGQYHVDSLRTLTVEAGTVILGDTAAALWIRRGAKLHAMGEPYCPVVFSSNQQFNKRSPGYWGGLRILGSARTPYEPNEYLGGFNDNDNSGVVKYTRVEFAGLSVQLGGELGVGAGNHGVFFAAVGSGTECHHVQSSFCAGDPFAWRGGLMYCRHLFAYRGQDDDFDHDLGFRGVLQFGFALRDEEFWNPAGESRGIESDGNGGSPTAGYTCTAPVLCNFTIVGPQRTDDIVVPFGATFDYGAIVRRDSRMSIFNSVITGYPNGLSVRDLSRDDACLGSLMFDCVSHQAGYSESVCTSCGYDPCDGLTVHNQNRWDCDGCPNPSPCPALHESITEWYDLGTLAPSPGGSCPRLPSEIQLSDMADLTDPDPRPLPNSELVMPGPFPTVTWDWLNPAHPRYANLYANPHTGGCGPDPRNSWLTPAVVDMTPWYRGAFPPSDAVERSDLWYQTFANFDPKSTPYTEGGCMGSPPALVMTIPDTTVWENNAQIEDYRDLRNVFAGTGLTFSIIYNSNPGLVPADIDFSDRLDLDFVPYEAGSATITVRATNPPPWTLYTETTFTVEVLPIPDAPLLHSITDIGNDQGRSVRIRFRRSGRDEPISSTPVTHYEAYRRIDPLPSSGASESVGGAGPACDERIRLAREAGMKSDPRLLSSGWVFAGAIPAHVDEIYSMPAPTLADSAISHGMHWSVFMIRAATESPVVFFDSAPDSGYSLDNLAPGVPGGFSVAYGGEDGNRLEWEPSSDPDFWRFRVYRSQEPEFEPEAEHLVHTTGETEWLDPVEDGLQYHYRLSACDSSGNESGAAHPAAATAVDAPIPDRHALYQNIPNPFNPSTTIRFDVPLPGGMVELRIYDVTGRRVRTLVNERCAPGHKRVTWDGRNDGGREVATGVYFYRMTAAGYVNTRKMLLVR